MGPEKAGWRLRLTGQVKGVHVRRWVHDDRMDGAVAVRELWSRLLATLETGDASAWADALAEDALVIGTDDVEWWQGKAAAMCGLDPEG